MADLAMPWGGQTLSADLPAGWTVQQTATPSLPSARADWRDHLARALANPEDSLPLGKLLAARRGGRVVVIVEDMTRHSPLEDILRVIFRELSFAKIEPGSVEIIFATGMHPPMTPDQAAQKLGAELARTYRWRCNDAKNIDAQQSLGEVTVDGGRLAVAIDKAVADADLRILVTSVSPHLQAGFGGGYKMLVPGCAQLATIRQLHLSGAPRRGLQQVGQPSEFNRMRRLIDAAGQAVDARWGKSFGVQYLLDDADQISAVAAGDVAACQRMLAKQCASGCGVIVDSPADVVITNACPRDFDLWQSFKSIANTAWAARDNGVIICTARCPAGANMPTFSLPISPAWVRRLIRWAGASTLAGLLSRLVPQLAGDAAFFVRLACQVFGRNMVYVVSPKLVETGHRMLGLTIFATLDEAFAAAEAHLGGGPKRVIVFPQGGISYPLMRRWSD